MDALDLSPRPSLADLDAAPVDTQSVLDRIRTRSRNIALGAATAAAALGLAGCGHGLTQGQVVEKHIEPARDYTVIIPLRTGQICTSSKVGSSTITNCTPIYTYIPWVVHDDQDWVLKLEQCANDKCRHGNVYVSEATYLATKVGDYYTKSHLDATKDGYTKLHKAKGREKDQLRTEHSQGQAAAVSAPSLEH